MHEKYKKLKINQRKANKKWMDGWHAQAKSM